MFTYTLPNKQPYNITNNNKTQIKATLNNAKLMLLQMSSK